MGRRSHGGFARGHCGFSWCLAYHDRPDTGKQLMELPSLLTSVDLKLFTRKAIRVALVFVVALILLLCALVVFVVVTFDNLSPT